MNVTASGSRDDWVPDDGDEEVWEEKKIKRGGGQLNWGTRRTKNLLELKKYTTSRKKGVKRKAETDMNREGDFKQKRRPDWMKTRPTDHAKDII